MKHLRMILAATVVGAFAAQGAMAACKAPEAPAAMPDGKTAQMDAMLAAKRSVDAYVEKVADYMKCEGDARKLQEAKARQTEILNWFNTEVRAFNAVNSPVKKARYR